jgi:hypothetical protein
MGGGGGAGGGGGSVDAGCMTMTIASVPSNGVSPDTGDYMLDTVNQGYAYEEAYVEGPGGSGAKHNYLYVTEYYLVGSFPGAPRDATLSSTDWTDCQDCITYSLGCDDTGGTCAEAYLAQGGTLHVSSATFEVDAGTFAGSVSNLPLLEWDFNNDIAVAGGKCIDVTMGSFSASWP